MTMDNVSVSSDTKTLDIASGRRTLKSIEPDGSLTYDESQSPEAKSTETLGRIWTEYPGGMLDIREDTFEGKDPDEPAVEDKPTEAQAEAIEKDKGMMMSFEDMARMREVILAQSNQSRNESWFVLELAKTLKESGTYGNIPPPPPSLLPQKAKPAPKAKPASANPSSQTSNSLDPPVIPPGTFSTTPALPPQKPLLTEVLELETALAAKQATSEQCGSMIDSAVDELTKMTAAADTFWADVRRLKEGRKGKGQWAVVPKPDFGRIADGQKAKDVIIPYAIDEASARVRARSSAAFDLDPKKKESAFGARSHSRLRSSLSEDDGVRHESTLPQPVPEDADVGEKMEEAQMESFDEDSFNEIRVEIMKRGGGVVEPLSVQFDIGGSNLKISLIDTREVQQQQPSTPSSPKCDILLHACRLSLLQSLRARKRRSLSDATQGSVPRATSLLAPLAQMSQHTRLFGQVQTALESLNRTSNSAGIRSTIVVRSGEDSPEVIGKSLEDGSLEMMGRVVTLEIADCPGVMSQTSAASPLLVNTAKASFSLADPGESLPILADAITAQILEAILPAVQEAAGEHAGEVFLDGMEDTIRLGDKGSLRLSIPAPWDSVQARVDNGEESFDSRRHSSLFDWVKTLFQSTGSSS